MYGLVVFTGLFVLLMLRPRYYRGVWELVIASKLAMTFTAVGYAAHGGIAGAGAIIGWDGGLAAVLIAAYICCRGWTAVPPAGHRGAAAISTPVAGARPHAASGRHGRAHTGPAPEQGVICPELLRACHP